MTLNLTSGEAVAPRTDENPSNSQTIGMAPISIGNPAIASALAWLDAGRPSVTGSATPQTAPKSTDTYLKAFRVKAGDTLSHILDRAGADSQTADEAIRALKRIFSPRDLKAGQTINVAYTPTLSSDGTDRFTGFQIPLDYATRVHVAPAPEGGFRAYEIELPLQTRQVRAEGTITNSLFSAGSDAGVPPSVMAELVRAFSWDVDFQRDIQKNDRFEVMFDQKVDEAGRPVHDGRIVYASLTLSGDRKPIYLHQLADGRWDYFDDKGQGAKKALMRTPIDGARLSSHFGNRKHPILGYTKKHTGTDFAAPTGTPIYAAGDGVVESAGWNGGYGKYVSIRHNSEYSTGYAHMSGINRGIAKGKRVRQGDIIGFVGTTGQSTGPHLHYEVVRLGAKMNPMRVKMPSGEKLSGKELVRFEGSRNNLNAKWASLAGKGKRLAQN
ncbi:MAG: peptidoglycan DD-metalloendopeptidase family protein [Rhodospirillales bacterium]|nr:peptidoglycan DD-metalloendopeptidase family protein [Rhodospirillales bacterium]